MFLSRSCRLIFLYWNVVRTSIIDNLLITVNFKIQRLKLSKWNHVIKSCRRLSINLFFKRCYWRFILNRKLKELSIQRVELELKLNITLLIKNVLSIFPVILNHSLTILLCPHNLIRQSFLNLHQSFSTSVSNNQPCHRFKKNVDTPLP